MSLKIKAKALPDGSASVLMVVSDDGTKFACNCSEFGCGYCSHIDAILRFGETGCVAEVDREKARRAAKLTEGRVKPPVGWVGVWRNNLYWRGVIPLCRDDISDLSTLTVYFKHHDEAEILSAKNLGLKVVQELSQFTNYVIDTEFLETCCSSETYGLSILTRHEWDILREFLALG